MMGKSGRGAALAALCAVALAGCAANGGAAGGPGKASAPVAAGATAAARGVRSASPGSGAPAAIPAHCARIMPALQAAFGYAESYIGQYNDPATHQLPHDMATYMQQNIDTYPGIECSVEGLIESSSPLTAADLQIRPYDDFWVRELLFSPPTPAQQCADLHITGELRSQGCWTSDGTYLIAVATPKIMVMGDFTLYQAEDQMSRLREAVHQDVERIVANA